MLKSIKYIDKIFEYETEEDLLDIIKKLEPHIRILGSDWKNKHATAQEFAESIYYHNRTYNYSTTDIKKRIDKYMKK